MDGGPGKINLAVTSTGVRRSLLTPSGDSAAAAVNYRAPARKRHSYSCLKKRKKEKERKQKKADRVHQIKLLHTTLSKPITWEKSEKELH